MPTRERLTFAPFLQTIYPHLLEKDPGVRYDIPIKAISFFILFLFFLAFPPGFVRAEMRFPGKKTADRDRGVRKRNLVYTNPGIRKVPEIRSGHSRRFPAVP